MSQATIFPADSLLQVCAHFSARDDHGRLARHRPAINTEPASYPDFVDVKGQLPARRALEIAAAGGHSILTLCLIKLGKSEGLISHSILIPGWPESCYAWRDVIPKLAQSGRRVIAIDPRGMGDSAHPSQGFTPQIVAAEIHRFAQLLGLLDGMQLDVAAHDVGAWIAYAYASDWPADVRTLTLLDAALPGVSPLPTADIPADEVNTRTWHFSFNRIPDLPEILVRGHEREYLTWLFSQKAARPWVFTPAVIDEYTRTYIQPGGTRTAFAYYRESFSRKSLDANKARASKMLEMPVMAIGGQSGVGLSLLNTMKGIARNVQGHVLADCGHFVMEECPEEVASHLLTFISD